MISQLPMLTPREFDQLTNLWNETQYEHSENFCANQIFEAIVEKNPEAITAICVEKSFDMVVGILAILKVRAYVHELVIYCGTEAIARHCRYYEKEDYIFDPLHCLPLLEQKVGELDQASPLQGWELPEAFLFLRRLLKSRAGKKGKREYVQVLRLLETFNIKEVHHAVNEAIHLRAISFDVVRHLLLCHIKQRPPRLDLESYPYLPKAQVETTSAKEYMELLEGALS